MRISNRFLKSINILLIIIALIAIVTWITHPLIRFFDESEQLRYEEEQRFSRLADGYSWGYRFGEEAAYNYYKYEEQFIDLNDDWELIAELLYEQQEPASICLGEEDCIDFLDNDTFEYWTRKSPYPDYEIWRIANAFKSGYIDGFVDN